MDAIATIMDATVQATVDAVETRFFKRWTHDALEFEGEDKGMPRAVGEGDEAYRARLANGHRQWTEAGTAAGLIRALLDLGFVATLDEGAVGVGHEETWYQFAVQISSFPVGFIDTSWDWGDGTQYGPEHSWGGISPFLASVLRDTIRRFKPCYARNYQIRVALPNGKYVYIQPVW